jgi:predicted CopG family antitoxin
MTTVRVSKDTRKRLAEIGTKEESFDQIIRRLIDFYKKYPRGK